MKEAASARPIGSRLGEIVFNAVAAALAFALLIATGRHLFAAAPYVTASEPPAITVAGASAGGLRATATAPPRSRTASALPARALSPKSDAVLPARAAVPVPPRAAVVTGQRPVVRRVSFAKRPPVGVAEAPRFQPPQRSARTAPERHAMPAGVVGRARPRAVAVRPVRAAYATPRSAAFARGTPKRSQVALRGAASGSAASHPHARSLSRSAHSIIEPPLGYDHAPTLIAVPAAATIDFGSATLPQIRSRRRY